LDPLFGRESPVNNNWMHQEMKKILPFYQFKRQSPARSMDQLSDGFRSTIELATPRENIRCCFLSVRIFLFSGNDV
jgi:hypothetical protein